MGVLDLLLPPACAGCGTSGALLCAQCTARLQRASEAASRFVVPDAGVVVGDSLCLAIAAFAHAGPMRRALAALKYAGARRLATPLARLVVNEARVIGEIAGDAVLVPVPVHRERLAARGYNQASLIATVLAKDLQIPMKDALQRVRPTTKQHGLDRASRLRNLRGAFVAPGPVASKAILVDDIITTTATLEACAEALRVAGCRQAYGLAIAREV